MSFSVLFDIFQPKCCSFLFLFSSLDHIDFLISNRFRCNFRQKHSVLDDVCWNLAADLCDKRLDFKSNLANYKSLCTLRLWREKRFVPSGGIVDRERKKKTKTHFEKKKKPFPLTEWTNDNEIAASCDIVQTVVRPVIQRIHRSIRFISCLLFWIKCWNVNYVLTLWTQNDHVIIPSLRIVYSKGVNEQNWEWKRKEKGLGVVTWFFWFRIRSIGFRKFNLLLYQQVGPLTAVTRQSARITRYTMALLLSERIHLDIESLSDSINWAIMISNFRKLRWYDIEENANNISHSFIEYGLIPSVSFPDIYIYWRFPFPMDGKCCTRNYKTTKRKLKQNNARCNWMWTNLIRIYSRYRWTDNNGVDVMNGFTLARFIWFGCKNRMGIDEHVQFNGILYLHPCTGIECDAFLLVRNVFSFGI